MSTQPAEIRRVVIDRRFHGPPDSGNGGYVCGLVASPIEGVAEVTLRVPPPLDTPLSLGMGVQGAVELRHGDVVVAIGAPAQDPLPPPEPPSFSEAEVASRRFVGFEAHVFPTCFVCGPDRTPDDGLCIFPGPVEGRSYVAAPWVPHASLADASGTLAPEFLWAALDCPGGLAWAAANTESPSVLGRMAARLDRLPHAGERCIAVGWRLGAEGRKSFAGSAVFGEDGGLLGVARQTWIQLAPTA